jgi:hypothetical protein
MTERSEQFQQVQDDRLPWLVPALKKGSIGSETANASGRKFDGAAKARS